MRKTNTIPTCKEETRPRLIGSGSGVTSLAEREARFRLENPNPGSTQSCRRTASKNIDQRDQLLQLDADWDLLGEERARCQGETVDPEDCDNARQELGETHRSLGLERPEPARGTVHLACVKRASTPAPTRLAATLSWASCFESVFPPTA